MFCLFSGNRAYERRAIERCNFDRARLIRHNRILAKNGIAPDGKLPFWLGGLPADEQVHHSIARPSPDYSHRQLATLAHTAIS